MRDVSLKKIQDLFKSTEGIKIKQKSFIESYAFLSLNELNLELLKLNEEYLILPPSYERTQRFHAVSTLIEQRVLERASLQDDILHSFLESAIEKEMNTNIRYVHELSGSRQLNEELFKSFCDKINALEGAASRSAIRYINEMIYEARFGYLVHDKRDNKAQSISKALEICYHLYINKKWRPTLIDTILSLRKNNV